MLTKIQHIGIVVKDLDETLKTYKNLFSLEAVAIKTTASSKIAFIPVADGEIEIIQPIRSDSRLGVFLRTQGEGIHHIAFETDDIEAEINSIRGKGVKMLDDKPRIGAHGVKIAFISPESTYGVVTELIEKA